ncbi:MAG: acetylglutamate kinase, partial [Ferruginibacter sp.]
TLKIVTMVYAGLVNKNIVAGLQANSCNAIGLTGADAGIITAHKRMHSSVDYGFAGDIDAIGNEMIAYFLNGNLTPVIAPITHDAMGQLLNTNADTIAQSLATAMAKKYKVVLLYCFEKKGVLMDISDEDSVVNKITASLFDEMKKKELISAGMIPKLDNAFVAIHEGVHKVVIGDAAEITKLIEGSAGTSIVHD